MNTLIIVFVAYTMLFGLLWHNKTSREEDIATSRKPVQESTHGLLGATSSKGSKNAVVMPPP